MSLLRMFSVGIAWSCALLASCVVNAQTPQLPPLNETDSGVRLPGKFVWFDLATPSIRAQMNFYGAVFGWSFDARVQSDDGYVLIMNEGEPVAGMFESEPPGGEEDGATWIALMSVLEPERASTTVEANGGSVEVAATQVPRRGRHALFRDPGGAIFGVLRSDTGDPPDAQVEAGGILWLDLFTRDVEAMADFYCELATYEVEERTIAEEIPGKFLTAHGLPRAGIVPVDEEANRSAWVPYVRVDNVPEILEKVVQYGGFAIVPPDERLLDGKLAVFVDPHGGVTGIVEWDYGEAAE